MGRVYIRSTIEIETWEEESNKTKKNKEQDEDYGSVLDRVVYTLPLIDLVQCIERRPDSFLAAARWAVSHEPPFAQRSDVITWRRSGDERRDPNFFENQLLIRL